MAYQSSVLGQIAAGIVGELAFEGPLIAQPGRLNTVTEANNVIGRAFTVVSGETGSWDGTDADAGDPAPLIVAAGGSGVFAGVLANPKVYTSYGVTGNTLGATLSLPNGTIVELVREGFLWVTFAAASSVGDIVYYNTTTGVLVTAAPGAAIPAGAAGPIGTVERFDNTAAGLAVVHLEPRVASVAP